MNQQGRHIRLGRLAASSRRGFTLMEIIVVVIIIAIMIAVSIPSMRAMAENNRLRSSIREIMNLMKYARSEAVFNARTTEVFLDTEKRQFWLNLRTPDEKTGKYDPKAPKTNMERKRDLQARVFFKAANVLTENILDKGIVAIDFFPDGTASPGLITVANEKGTEYTVEVYKSTGLVELNGGDLEELQDKNKTKSYPLPPNYDEAYSGGSSQS